jgi:hypothetical protein
MVMINLIVIICQYPIFQSNNQFGCTHSPITLTHFSANDNFEEKVLIKVIALLDFTKFNRSIIT